jgi:hypothetical protein
VTTFSASADLLDKITNVSAAPSSSRMNGPLTATHRSELAAARDRSKVIRKAARVAGFNAWTTGGMAALSGAFLLFDHSVAALLITMCLSIVAVNEFRGRKQLLSFDPGAASLLGWNQLGLLAAIIVYCLWMLYGSATGSSELSAALDGYNDLGSFDMGQIDNLYHTASYAAYGGAIVLSILFQGGNAFYYFTRRRHLENFVAETPAWVREVATV